MCKFLCLPCDKTCSFIVREKIMVRNIPVTEKCQNPESFYSTFFHICTEFWDFFCKSLVLTLNVGKCGLEKSLDSDVFQAMLKSAVFTKEEEDIDKQDIQNQSP